MLKTLIATTLLSFSTGAKSFIQPKIKKINYTDSSSSFYQSSYNFRDYIDIDSLDSYMTDKGITTISDDFRLDKYPTSGMPLYGFTTPCSIDEITYYVENIHFYYAVNDSLEIEIAYYYLQEQTQYLYYEFTQNTSLSSLSSTFQNFIFDIRNGLVIDNYCNILFDTLFTTQDNQYTTSYSGYFTWLGMSYYTNPFTVFGTELYSNYIYYNLYSYHISNSWDHLTVDYSSFDTDDIAIYDMVRYTTDTIPFKMENMSKYMLVQWKMSKTAYTRLQTYGVFNYVHDTTYDNANFQDLLFSIMDSPFYMISRFLNWQLFGVNMFVAFTGLLTLCVICVLIRKFW